MKQNKKTVLVTGAGGQLGCSFRQLEGLYPEVHFIFADRTTLAVEDAAVVETFFAHNIIDYCINCAAYTAVDKAETEPALAFAINAVAAGQLADVCRRYSVAFVHISTDYVFSGTATEPYKETDVVNPVNTYGASKLQGEQLVSAANPAALIIRTSWLYSPFGHNFVKTMLRLMKEKESISVVNDQLGRPTYAPHLAAAIMQIINEGKFSGGTYHFSNSGEPVSWYGFAIAIKTLANSSCNILPTDTAGFPTAAKRPLYSVLDITAIQNNFLLTIPQWKDGLTACLKQIQ